MRQLVVPNQTVLLFLYCLAHLQSNHYVDVILVKQHAVMSMRGVPSCECLACGVLFKSVHVSYYCTEESYFWTWVLIDLYRLYTYNTYFEKWMCSLVEVCSATCTVGVFHSYGLGMQVWFVLIHVFNKQFLLPFQPLAILFARVLAPVCNTSFMQMMFMMMHTRVYIILITEVQLHQRCGTKYATRVWLLIPWQFEYFVLRSFLNVTVVWFTAVIPPVKLWKSRSFL